MADLEALTEGNPTSQLTALRDLLARRLGEAETKVVAGLSREYRAVVAELERRGAGREESNVDEVALRRARRRARRGSAGPAPAADQDPAAGG